MDKETKRAYQLVQNTIVENLEVIPDGTLTINHANPKYFDFKM